MTAGLTRSGSPLMTHRLHSSGLVCRLLRALAAHTQLAVHGERYRSEPRLEVRKEGFPHDQRAVDCIG
jgi:hypothetical protein